MKLLAFLSVLFLGHALFSQTPSRSLKAAWNQAKSSSKKDSKHTKKVLEEAEARFKKQLERKDLTHKEQQRFENALKALQTLSDRLDVAVDKTVIDAINDRADEILWNLGPNFSDQDLVALENLVHLESIPFPSKPPIPLDPVIVSATLPGTLAVSPPETICASCGPGQQCTVGCAQCVPGAVSGTFLCPTQ